MERPFAPLPPDLEESSRWSPDPRGCNSVTTEERRAESPREGDSEAELIHIGTPELHFPVNLDFYYPHHILHGFGSIHGLTPLDSD